MGSSELTYIENVRLEWNPHDKGPDSLLGEGAFGSVYRGTLDITEVAIKVIKRSTNGLLQSEQAKQAQKAALKQHERELRRLKKLKHPNVVQYLGAACDPATTETLIVTELLSGGSLHEALQVMRNYGPSGEGGAVLEERSFLRIGAGIASGLLYLHNSEYTHGDMKPHNVLLTSTVEILDDGTRAVFQKDVQAKIADFGLSRSIGKKADDLMATTNTQDFGAGPVGTFAYMAPQAFDGIAKMSGGIAKAADIYAFAIVMYELLSGRQPWLAENVRSVWTLCRYVCSDERRPSWGPREGSIRPEYISFVKRCWAQQWEDRPNSDEVARQFRAWIKEFKKRESGSLDGTDFSIGSPETGSPSVLENDDGSGTAKEAVGSTEENQEPEQNELPKENPKVLNGTGDNLEIFPDLGNDENGKPYLERIKSEVLDEREAIEVIKRHVLRDTMDFGDSTDTRIDDSSNQMPALPENEVSEYDDNVGETRNDSTTSPAVPSMQLPAQSALDLLNSAQFNNFVKRVNTEAVPLPDIEKLDVGGLPIPKREEDSAQIEKPSMGLDIVVNAAGVVQKDMPAYFGNSGKDDKGDKNEMQESFLRAFGVYNGEDVSEAPTTKPDVQAAESKPDPKLEMPPLAIPSLQMPLPGHATSKKQAVDWEISPEAVGSELSSNDKTSAKVEPKDDPVRPLAPVIPEGAAHFPPSSNVSPPQHPVHPNPPMIYQNIPAFPGYGPVMNTSIISSGTMWHSDPHRANVSSGLHTANSLAHNGSSPPQMMGNPAPHPMYGGVPQHVVPLSLNVAIEAIRSPTAAQTLERYWNAGHARVIAMAFAHGATQTPATLSGKANMDLALEFIKRNNQAPKEPLIARDLCVAVGSFAMNPSNSIDKVTAMGALPVALSAMQSNHNNVEVYSSCCFAMSNLLKISNHIEDANLRKDVAVWIVHAISWNLSRGTKLDSLAYTACSAARNYMWLNELNTSTFLWREDKLFNAPPLRKLLISMNYFRIKEKVLEASLSALAMVAYFPANRQQLFTDDGVRVMLDILRHSFARSNASCLCLSILNVLVSEPGPATEEERSLCRKSLLENSACGVVLQALLFSTEQQKAHRNLGVLQLEEEALATIVALCEYDTEIRSAMVKNNAVLYVTEALRGFAVVHVTLIHSTLLTNCAIQMCEAAYSLAKSPVGLKGLLDNDAIRFLKTIKTLFRDDERLVNSATKVISVLTV